MSVIYLVLWMCTTSCQYDQRALYIADTFVGETVDAASDCHAAQMQGRAYYRKAGIKDTEVHCWTRADIAAKGYIDK